MGELEIAMSAIVEVCCEMLEVASGLLGGTGESLTQINFNLTM